MENRWDKKLPLFAHLLQPAFAPSAHAQKYSSWWKLNGNNFRRCFMVSNAREGSSFLGKTNVTIFFALLLMLNLIDVKFTIANAITLCWSLKTDIILFLTTWGLAYQEHFACTYSF
jgi:hypothetical protein